MRFRFSAVLLFATAVTLCCPVLAQDRGQDTSANKQPPQASDPLPRSEDDEHASPPLGNNESSSKQTQIDISPPKDDAAEHPDSDVSDVTEMHTWNPHRAQKDVEVGEYYLKHKNYRAAEDRLREALMFKPGDAIATFRLAEVLDAQGRSAEAAKQYEEYLKIPSSEKFAPEAKKALMRLEQKATQNHSQ
ncbi:MAG TPA: tetratricopeptide repeat protein [Terriglobales bacterium]|jgi:tetratricopeptide (TPR) repeat protein|nr:tetratricopeptide repeat protein [Terriglobales bacterium]